MTSYLTILYRPDYTATALAGWDELERFLNPEQMFDEIHIINPTPDASPARVGTLRIHSLPNRWWHRLVKFPLSPLFSSLRIAAFARQLIRRHQIPLVIQNEGNILDNGIPSVLAARGTGVPCVITLLTDNRFSFRVTSPYLKSSWINRRLERWVLGRATVVRCVSPYLRRYAVEHGVEPGRIFEAPLRAFTTRVVAIARSGNKVHAALAEKINGRKVLLSAGRFVPQKNLIAMIRGFAIARRSDPNLLYCLSGTGPLRNAILKEIDRLGLTADVLMLDWLPFDEVASLLSQSSACLMVSLCEGTPRVLQQAYALGVPVIGSTSGHFEGLIEDGVTGVRADPLNPDSIAKAIHQVTSDASTLSRLKQGALRAAPRFLDASVEEAEKNAFLKILHASANDSQPRRFP